MYAIIQLINCKEKCAFLLNNLTENLHSKNIPKDYQSYALNMYFNQF